MVAASRSGSTSAVMRLSSPSASTFSSQASRSLLLGLPGRASVWASRCAGSAAPTLTLISMTLSPRTALSRLSFDHQLGIIDVRPPRAATKVARPAHVGVHLAQRARHHRQVLFGHAGDEDILQAQ